MIESLLIGSMTLAIAATILGFIRRSSPVLVVGSVSALVFGAITIFSVGLLGLMLAIFDGVGAFTLRRRGPTNSG